MLKKLIFLPLFILAISTGIAQTPNQTCGFISSKYLMRSTLGSSGSSSIISTGKGDYRISQSIGQASVIGTYHKTKYTIRQGFQQPPLSVKPINIIEENLLKANLFPNPFKQSIHVLFEEMLTNQLFVSINNQQGGIVYAKAFPPNSLLSIPLEFLPAGNYILKISTENKQLITKIIKQ